MWLRSSDVVRRSQLESLMTHEGSGRRATVVMAKELPMKSKQKRWHEFTPAQKTLMISGAAAQVGLLVAALWDLSRRPASKINGKKSLWVAASFVSFVGPISYFCRGRKKR